MSQPIILAITGASGAIYSVRLLEELCRHRLKVHLLISRAGQEVLKQELGIEIDIENFELTRLFAPHRFRSDPIADAESFSENVHFHTLTDWMSPPASGSYLTEAMVICPCSGGTLSAIVTGASQNLIHRAAEVHLKEGRKLIIVPRETPLSAVALGNLKRAAEVGCVVLPAMPGWYHGVRSIDDLVDFMVARILDQLRIPHQLTARWGRDGDS